MRARLAGEPSLTLESSPLTIELTCPASTDAGLGSTDAASTDAGGAPLAVVGLAALAGRRRG